MSHHKHIQITKIGKAICYYDARSKKSDEIIEYINSATLKNIEKNLDSTTHICLGGDGLFVYVAKIAHNLDEPIIGINFGNIGFLVQEKEVFEKNTLSFIEKKFPILKVIVNINGEEKIDYAFNEVFITRSADSSSIQLDISHLGKEIKNYRGDGIMLSTPAGSTGWSYSYSGIIIPHGANLNLLTPIGNISPRNMRPLLLSDKGRVRIQKNCDRVTATSILIDNQGFIIDTNENFNVIIERSKRPLKILIENSNIKYFSAKAYGELGFINYKSK